MAALINILVGILTPRWGICFAIAACVAAADAIFLSGPKVQDRDMAYIVAYLTGIVLGDLLFAAIGHGVRRLFIKFAG